MRCLTSFAGAIGIRRLDSGWARSPAIGITGGTCCPDDRLRPGICALREPVVVSSALGVVGWRVAGTSLGAAGGVGVSSPAGGPEQKVALHRNPGAK